MHRTQIYFELDTFEKLKLASKELNVSVSEFIRSLVKRELKAKEQKKELFDFIDTLKKKHLNSFKDNDSIEYIDGMRAKSRLI